MHGEKITERVKYIIKWKLGANKGIIIKANKLTIKTSCIIYNDHGWLPLRL